MRTHLLGFIGALAFLVGLQTADAAPSVSNGSTLARETRQPAVQCGCQADRSPFRSSEFRNRNFESISLQRTTAVFLRSPRRLKATAGTAVLSLLHRNSLPSTHIRCRTTASRLATATIARRIPRRWATRTPHAFSHDHFAPRVSSACAAS